MKRLGVVLVALTLTSCTTTRYKPLCPPLVHYTADEQKQAAQELHTHPDLREIPVMLRDYGNERGEILKGYQ